MGLIGFGGSWTTKVARNDGMSKTEMIDFVLEWIVAVAEVLFAVLGG